LIQGLGAAELEEQRQRGKYAIKRNRSAASGKGSLPFDFAGVLKIDLETGETILEPRDRSEEQLARACAVLTGG
jgi:hypothetical protein